MWSGQHGGARDAKRCLTHFMQRLVEYHAWQVLKYDPRLYVISCYVVSVCISCVCMMRLLSLFLMCVCVCRYTLHGLSTLLFDHLNVHVSRSWLSRMLHRWRWSFKNINHKHVRKFTTHNIMYYGNYLINIQSIPLHRIKFIDEASFSSRGQWAGNGWRACRFCICLF